MYQLSIIIPCYNEQNSINKLVERCYLITKNRNDIQFIFVNNGSTDKTRDNLSRIKVELNFVNALIVEVPINKGYGYGIKCGLLASKSSILAWTHADLQTDPLDVIEAYDLNRNKLELEDVVVKGLRNRRPAFDVFFTKVMSFFCTLILRKKLIDVNAQPKIFNKKLLKIIENAPNDFLFDLYFLYAAQVMKFEVLTFAVNFMARKYGNAKGADSLLGKFKISFKTIFYTLKLKNENIIYID
jgi:glycosyltransferase involved in cell wall biosynthesis